MTTPATTKTPIQGSRVTAPTIPIAAAPLMETAASAARHQSGIDVRSGRPFSSSSA